MDEEFLKRNTDCVYFLASPFTCRKGVECEYRHNEMARMNPRDCWYWTTDGCLNPTCGFRHPETRCLHFIPVALSKCNPPTSCPSAEKQQKHRTLNTDAYRGRDMHTLEILVVANIAYRCAFLQNVEERNTDQNKKLFNILKPLEVRIDASVEAASSLQNSFVSASKSGIPCYFYYNGYCNKGDGCPFLHGPDDSTARKSKLTQEVSDAPALDTMTSPRAAVPLPAGEKYPSPSERVLQIDNELQAQHKRHVQLWANNEIIESNAFRQVSVHDIGKTANTQLSSLLLPENGTRSEPSLSSDESSEDQVDDYKEQDEWLEKSPGFDVLVDRRSEDIGYEEEQKYSQALDRNDEDLQHHCLDFGYEDQMDYENRILLGYGINKSSVYFDDLHRFDIGGCSPRNSRERKLRKVNRIVSHKRKLLTVELPVRGRNTMDLRDHLRKRRMVDDHLELHDSRTRKLSYVTDRRRKILQRHGVSQRVCGRLSSKMGRNGIELPMEEKTLLVSGNWQRRSTNSWHDRFSQYHEMKKQPFSDNVARKPFTKWKRQTEDSIFAGPKTLAQIKEEMRKAQEDCNLSGKMGQHSSENISADFEGPKRLSELLKDKKKVAVSVGNGDTNGSP
ncbi:hypothetical protein Ancab_006900 [Ancistrocladus abbreviatus]